MERLMVQTGEQTRWEASVVPLLDRVWSMHPERTPGEIMAWALETQVRHLAALPVRNGWLLKFLRTLPSSAVPPSCVHPASQSMMADDITSALADRRAFHGDASGAIYQDTMDICRVASIHLDPGVMCCIAARACQAIRRGEPHQGT